MGRACRQKKIQGVLVAERITKPAAKPGLPKAALASAEMRAKIAAKQNQ
jgi:hypothetical protein